MTGQGDEASGTSSDTSQPRGGPSNRALAILAVIVVLAGGFAILAPHLRASASQPTVLRATGIPTDISTQTAALMGLTPVPAKRAPGFVLTDQHAATMSIAAFRGKAVVLEFMDPHCTDICPIVSQEFVDANRYLGPTASKVAFVAVNVNQYHNSVAAMSSYSQAHLLDTIPSWHFFTGAVPALKSVWRAYGVDVQAPNPNADIIHTSVVYFIDAKGHERYAAFPLAEHTAAGTAFLPASQVTAWGHGIALLAGQLSR